MVCFVRSELGISKQILCSLQSSNHSFILSGERRNLNFQNPHLIVPIFFYFIVTNGLQLATVRCNRCLLSTYYSSTKSAKRSIASCKSSGIPSSQEGTSNAIPSKAVNISWGMGILNSEGFKLAVQSYPS